MIAYLLEGFNRNSWQGLDLVWLEGINSNSGWQGLDLVWLEGINSNSGWQGLDLV